MNCQQHLDKENDIMEMAETVIFICLGDKVLREVSRDTSAAAIWLKIKHHYMKKSLSNHPYLKQRLYSFKIKDKKNLSDQIDEYLKILDDLKPLRLNWTMKIKILIVLNALPII